MAEQKKVSSRKIISRSARQLNRVKAKKKMTTTMRARSHTSRAVSSSSSSNKGVKKTTVVASGTIKRGVVRTVRGKTAGRGRTIRVVPE